MLWYRLRRWSHKPVLIRKEQYVVGLNSLCDFGHVSHGSPIRNPRFRIRNISPLPRATTCMVLSGATRCGAHDMATRREGARK